MVWVYRLEGVGKTRDNASVVFGRSVALLLVMLFVLTGTQMGLSLVQDYSRGTVLGEESDEDDKENKKWWNKYKNVSPTATPTAAPTPTSVTSEEPPAVSPSEEPAPTGEPSITTEPTPTQATSGESASTPPPEADQPLAGSASETVRTFLKQIGLPVSVKPTPPPIPEKITVKEEVINERQAGEILKELETAAGLGVQREARLRFVISNGGVGLRAEFKAGQGIVLATEEAAKISETLRLGSGLRVDRGSDTELVFSRGTVRASTNLPLLVDLDSNSLMVETSIGIKNVAVLPDTAAAKAVAEGALTDVEGRAMNLIERDDGKIAYRMSGQVGRKLFGFFDIKAEKSVDVSAESGRVLPSLTDSLGATLFNIMAPVK